MWKVMCLEAFGYGVIAIVIIQFLWKAYQRIRTKADALLEDMKRQEEQILWEKVLQLQKTANNSNETNRKRRTSAAEIFEMYSPDKKVLQHPSANIHLGLDDEDILELLSLLSNNDDKKSNPKSVSEITKKFEVNDMKPKTHVARVPKWQKKKTDDLFVGSKVPQKSFTRKENVTTITRCEDDSKVNKAPRYKRAVAPIIKPPTPVITNGLQNGNVNGNYENDHELYGTEPITKTKELNNNYNNNYQNESNFHENNLFNKKDRSASPSESSEISEIIKNWRDTSPIHISSDTPSPKNWRDTSPIHISSDTPSPVESTPSDINEHTLNGNTSNSDDDDRLSVDYRGNTEAVKSFDEILSQERFSRRLSDYSISDLIEGNSIDPNIDDIIDEIIK